MFALMLIVGTGVSVWQAIRATYKQRHEADRKEKGDGYKIPLPVWLKRLQAEAAAMLGVTPPTVEPTPEPAAKAEEAKTLPQSVPALEAAKEEEKWSRLFIHNRSPVFPHGAFRKCSPRVLMPRGG
ncbi:MAG: hypothetical protein ACYC3X_21065 [Pirellulaceae bacterium]